MKQLKGVPAAPSDYVIEITVTVYREGWQNNIIKSFEVSGSQC